MSIDLHCWRCGHETLMQSTYSDKALCYECSLQHGDRPEMSDMPRVLTDEEYEINREYVMGPNFSEEVGDDILTNQFIQRLYATIDALKADRDRAVAELEVVALSRNVYSTSLNMMEREQNAMLSVVRAAMEWYCAMKALCVANPDLARRIEEVSDERAE